jgi:hypothetical protein
MGFIGESLDGATDAMTGRGNTEFAEDFPV